MTSSAEVTQELVNEVMDFLRGFVVGRLAAHAIRGVFHDCVGGSSASNI